MKSGSFKCPPKNDLQIYKNIDIVNLISTLKKDLERVNYNSCESFENIVLNALNIYFPSKRKMLRFSNSAFTINKLKEEVERSKLKNNFNKNRNDRKWCKYENQRETTA